MRRIWLLPMFATLAIPSLGGDSLMQMIGSAIEAAEACGYRVDESRLVDAERLANSTLPTRVATSDEPAPAIIQAPEPGQAAPTPPPIGSPAPEAPDSRCDRLMADFGPHGAIFVGLIIDRAVIQPEPPYGNAPPDSR